MTSGIVVLALAATFASVAQAGQLVRGVWREEGDIRLGLIVPAHDNNGSALGYDTRYVCGDLTPSTALLVPFIRLEIAKVNADSSKLHGLTLGLDVIDSCVSPPHAVDLATPWATNKVKRLGGALHLPAPPLVALGAYYSRVAAPTAVYLQQFDIPLIDFGSTSADLSERRRYSLYARTSPSDKFQASALAAIVARLGYSSVHLVYSEGIYGDYGAVELRVELAKLNIAIVTDQKAPTSESNTESLFNGFVANIDAKSSASKAIVCFCEDTTSRSLLRGFIAQSVVGKFQLINSDFWELSMDLTGLEAAANNAIIASATTDIDPGFDTAAFTQLARDDEQDPYFREFLENKFGCSLCGSDKSKPKCNPSAFTFNNGDLPATNYLSKLRLAFSATINGLSKLIASTCASYSNKRHCLPQLRAGQNAKQLYSAIREDASFDDNGDGFASYNLWWYSSQRAGADRYRVVASWSKGALSVTDAFNDFPKN